MQTNIKTTDAPPGSLHPVVQRAVALSIRQPWAWLIVNGYKDIENRDWTTKFRGRFLVHASKGMTRQEYDQCLEYCQSNPCGFVPLPDFDKLERGGIVGDVELVDCVNDHPSFWFNGEYGFVLQCARVLPFVPLKGMLGFFTVSTLNDKLTDGGHKTL